MTHNSQKDWRDTICYIHALFITLGYCPLFMLLFCNLLQNQREIWDWGVHSNRDLPRDAPGPVSAHPSSKGGCRKWRGSSNFQSSRAKPLVFGNGVGSDLYCPQTCVALNLRNSVGFLLDKFMENGNMLRNLTLSLLCARPALPLADFVSFTENCLIIRVCCGLRYLVVHLPRDVCR